MTKQAALAKAIDLMGSQQALADRLGIKSPSITEWRQRNRVPAERCISIEEATGREVTRYELRPDVFGAGPGAGQAAHVAPDEAPETVLTGHSSTTSTN
jgi:hypothetical protein